TRSQCLSRRPFGPLLQNAPSLYRTRSGARRWPLCQSLAVPRPRRSAHPRRLGTGDLQCRSTPRSARDRREDRYDARSIIITSQARVDPCYAIAGDPTLADAILDRVIHNAYRIELPGESLRKAKKTAGSEPATNPPLTTRQAQKKGRTS